MTRRPKFYAFSTRYKKWSWAEQNYFMLRQQTIDDNDKGLVSMRFPRLIRNDQGPVGKIS